jgi:hypothetical protein
VADRLGAVVLEAPLASRAGSPAVEDCHLAATVSA